MSARSLSAIDGLPRSASIVAIVNSIVARMPPAAFRATVHAYPDVCDQLLALLASQIRMLANRVSEYDALDVRARIHSELLRLARPARDGEGSAVISPVPTHSELAARVSSRREAVTRELNNMERAGLLQRRRGVSAGNAGAAAEHNCLQIRVREDAARDHVVRPQLAHALHVLERLIDRHGADRHRTLGDERAADAVDVAPRREIHHRVGPVFQGDLELP